MATNNIKVVCRFRPPNNLELREGGGQIVSLDPDGATVTIGEDITEINDNNTFTFDRIFDSSSTQREVFDYSISSTVDDVLKGYNGTVFAYGQTGSGKTFTMMGAGVEEPNLKGIIPRIIESIFTAILASPETMEYTVNVSYMEIYMERIRDLLNPINDNLQIHEEKNRGIYVKGLMEVYVSSVDEVYDVMRQGGASRAVAYTNMNAESSRSHSIFVVTINQKNILDGGSLKSGKLYLVDLAGSEKVGKTGASGQTLEEAKKINKSLSSLGMVINALTDGKSSHIPYRDSKLTRILQESLGGNSRTTLIINCSPAAYNVSETISTLRFGMRAKKIQNKAKINQDLSPAELKILLKKAKSQVITFQQYIQLLEKEIDIWRSGGTVLVEEQASLGNITVSKTKPTLGQIYQEHLSTPLTNEISSTNSTQSLTSPTIPESDSSRPWTPPTITDDEREEFLSRETVLMDALTEKDDMILKLQKELSCLSTNGTSTLLEENKLLSEEITLLKADCDKLKYEKNDLMINYDTLADQTKQFENSLNEALQRISQLEKEKNSPGEKRKEKNKDKRIEKIAKMMAQSSISSSIGKQEKEMKDLLDNLERMEGNEILTPDQTMQLKKEAIELRIQIQGANLQLAELKEDKELLQGEYSILAKKAKSIEADYDELLANTIYTEMDNQITVTELKSRLESQYERKVQEHSNDLNTLQKRYEAKISQVESLRAQTQDLLRENESVKSALSQAESAYREVMSDDRIVILSEDMKRQLEEFQTLKTSLAIDLEERCEKITELEMTLEETQKEYQNSLNQNHKHAIHKRKLDMLESQLEQLIGLHKDLVEQNHSLKKDSAVFERKLNTRNERIESLEKLLYDSQAKFKAQSERFETQFQMLKDRTEYRSRMGRANSNPIELFQELENQSQASQLQFSRIAKPVRGGARAVNGVVSPTSQSSPAPPRNVGMRPRVNQTPGSRS